VRSLEFVQRGVKDGECIKDTWYYGVRFKIGVCWFGMRGVVWKEFAVIAMRQSRYEEQPYSTDYDYDVRRMAK